MKGSEGNDGVNDGVRVKGQSYLKALRRTWLLLCPFTQTPSALFSALRLTAVAILLQIACPGAWAVDTTQLQMKLVEQRIEALKQQGATAADSATLQAYQSTLNWLRETENFEQLAAQSISEQASAAQEEASIQARLTAVDTEVQLPDIKALEALSPGAMDKEVSQLRDVLQDLISQRTSLDQQISTEVSNADRIRARLNAIDLEESALPESHARFEPGGAPTQFEASQWQLAAHRNALNAERRALNAQLSNQPLSGRLRRAQREELIRKIEQLQQNIGAAEELQVIKRSTQAGPLMQDLKPGTADFELLRQLSEENARLATHRTQLNSNFAKADAEKVRANGRLFELMDSFNSARRLVDSGGRVSLYGPFLMNHYMRLDHFRPPAEKLRQSNSISEIVIDRARHEQQLSELLDTDQFIARQLEGLGSTETLPDYVRNSATQLLQDRSSLLSDMMSRETELIELLGNIDISYQQLDSLIEEFKAFLIGHILWVRSHLPLDRDVFKQLWLDTRQAIDSLQFSMAFNINLLAIIAMLAGLSLLLLRRRMWRRMEIINRRIGRPRNDSIIYSVEILLLTLLRSAAVPLVMVGLGLSIETNQQGLLQPLALSLLTAAGGVMAALFLRDSSTAGGICRTHFDWPEGRCKSVSNLMTWILIRLMPVVIAASFLVHLEQNTPHAVLGRLFLCFVAIMVAAKLLRMLARQRKLQASQTPDEQFAKRFPNWIQDGIVWVSAGFLIFIVLSGFLLPARIVYTGLAITALIFVGAIFLHELLMRWLLVARRRIRFQQLMAAQPGTEGEEKAETEARRTSLGDLSDSTAQLIKSLVYVSTAVSVILVWKPLMPAVQGLQRFTLWSVSQTVNGVQLQTQITLATLFLAILIFFATFYAARRIPALIELILRSTGRSTPATRYTISTITNYVIIAIGTMVFFSTLKMSWSQLQWLVAALGVGIGFGLQEIVANFISGLIILFERPIRVGDVVTIGESTGTVTRIQIRATTIRDWDGKELLVPNKEFITGRLLNWTLSDTNNRIVIDVGIAYGSDVAAAMKILEDVVTLHPAILDEPRPNILFTQFGDNALLLSARCFLADLDDRLRRVSELNQQIYTAFNEAGIVIAFPQLDVHLDPESPLTVRLQDTSEEPAKS